MSAEEFTRWLENRQWTTADAVKRLGVSRVTLWKYRTGKRPVSRAVQATIAALDGRDPAADVG
jgi:transcriptional regulator with XRE-family HTH domain